MGIKNNALRLWGHAPASHSTKKVRVAVKNVGISLADVDMPVNLTSINEDQYEQVTPITPICI